MNNSKFAKLTNCSPSGTMALISPVHQSDYISDILDQLVALKADQQDKKDELVTILIGLGWSLYLGLPYTEHMVMSAHHMESFEIMHPGAEEIKNRMPVTLPLIEQMSEGAKLGINDLTINQAEINKFKLLEVTDHEGSTVTVGDISDQLFHHFDILIMYEYVDHLIDKWIETGIKSQQILRYAQIHAEEVEAMIEGDTYDQNTISDLIEFMITMLGVSLNADVEYIQAYTNDVATRKNHDYKARVLSMTPHSILTVIVNKLQRLEGLLTNDQQAVDGEPVNDVYIDITNYCLYLEVMNQD